MEDTVYEVGVCAFEGCKGLTEIRFSENLFGIGQHAFSGCTGLTAVTLPPSLEGIGVGAFSGCTGLTQVSLPELKSILSGTFQGCTGLRSMTLPDSMRRIESYAFYGCSNLSELHLPESLTTIDHLAFQDCGSLTQITIPDSVTELAINAFDGCTSLEAFQVTAGNDAFCSVDGVLYDKEQRVLIKYPEGKKNDTFTISADVTALEDRELKSPYLAEINVAPGNEDFSSLDGVLFNADQTELIRVPRRKQGAYEIPQRVCVIDPFSLQNCTSLRAVTIPAGVHSDWSEYQFFTGCVSLEEIRVAEDNEDFSSLDGMLLNKAQTELICCPPGKAGACTIPAGVEQLGGSEFSACPLLTDIHVAPENENLSSIDGVLYDKAQTGLIRVPCGRQGDFVIPASVKSIWTEAFKNCAQLTSVTIPDGEESIGYEQFKGCKALTSVTIPASVRDISRAFDFDDADSQARKDFIIYGVPGSEAQRAAEEYGFRFEPIGAAAP